MKIPTGKDNEYNDRIERASALDTAAGSVFDLECCPHCKGTSGFLYLMTLKGEQWQRWGKVDHCATHFTQIESKHGAYRCDDCGKIIKVNSVEPARSDSD